MKRLEKRLAQLNKVIESFVASGKKATKGIKKYLFSIIEEIDLLERKIAFLNHKAHSFRELILQTGRKQWKAWVAKISAKRDKVHGGYSKEFIEPVSREFNRKGETSATFNIQIDLNQIYQDSEGDFWVFENLDGDIKVISYQEVQYRFDAIPF